MQIDWITVAAQIVNFLILIWLLNRVLYRPLNRALAERAAAVRHELDAAVAAQAAADAAAAEHRAALAALTAEEAARLDAATAAAAAERRARLHQAQAEVAAQREAWVAELTDDKAAFLDRLRRDAGAAFVTLARHALAEMSDTELMDAIARVFARRLAALDPAERQRLAAAVAGGAPVAVLVSQDLSPAAQAIVDLAVTRLLGPLPEGTAIACRHDPDLEGGVMLMVGARHIGWTLGEHLDAFEDEVAARFGAGVAAGAA